MGEWAAEGLLRRLTDPTDAAARRLLNSTVFYVVPNMCAGTGGGVGGARAGGWGACVSDDHGQRCNTPMHACCVHAVRLSAPAAAAVAAGTPTARRAATIAPMPSAST